MATDWRAVGVGFVVLLVTGVVGLQLPVIGQIGAGLVGGAGVLVVGLFATVLFALDSALAGALGALLE